MNRPPSILPLALGNVVYRAAGKRLIDGVSCTFEAGPRSVIMGPNGAGKSLFLRLCHGLIRPAEGNVVWRGGGDAAHRQAMVFQRPVMLRRSVQANVDYALKLRKIPKLKRRAITQDVLARTGLGHLRRRPARVLSFGEQQRLALARAWAPAPQVLFLDEPTASLDPAATHAVEEIVNAIHHAGTRIIMTTHDLAQARRMADEVLFLYRGRLLEKTPAAIFFKQPKTDTARAFIRGELLWRNGADRERSTY